VSQLPARAARSITTNGRRVPAGSARSIDLPDPTPGDGEQLFEICSSGVNDADTHHCLS
jgi:hypothetical protein